ncbi:MAG TPA: 3-oxoacyl-[acyl-carrier-protein] synthase III C-terminal domain-containing protein [Archangium sp.]|nr:3-oxoacyl-[acyl-carrier-protein] synthase III C-terminal domain-containing protein [Archangium sp.]
MKVPSGGSRLPTTPETLARGLQHWKLQFSQIGEWAVNRMAQCAIEVMKKAGVEATSVRHVVAHQASARILRDVAERLSIDFDRFVLTYPDHGNMSSASIPAALDVARRARRFRHGDWILMPAVGAGMAWGALMYRWWNGGV